MNKQIQIKWPRNKDGSILTLKKWARLNLSKDEYEKFLDAAENHQRAVVEAILKGDAVNYSTPNQVDIRWKDENTHKKYMSMISEYNTKIWKDTFDLYWNYINENHDD